MAEDSLRSAIEEIRRRLEAELHAQLGILSARLDEELQTVQRVTQEEAEQRWAGQLEAARAEWAAKLQTEVNNARSEAERRMVAETMRLRVEAEQAAADANARRRQEIETALKQERERAASQLANERQQLEHELDGLRLQLRELQQQHDEQRAQLEAAWRDLESATAALDQAQASLDEERRARVEEARQQEHAAEAAAEARVAERQAQLQTVERLLGGIRSLDAGRSLSDVLSALTTAAAAEAPRIALFVINGTELRGWKFVGFDASATSVQASINDEGLLGEAIRKREPVVTADGAGPATPAFAALPPDRAAIAVPLLVGSRPVALLYADDASDEPARAPDSWPEAIQILGRHASVNLAHLTTARAAEAMRRSVGPVTPAPAGAAIGGAAADDPNSARRYARLLLSEIKVYNEAAVRVGREHRDLLRRLKPEIERARKLYEERVPPAVDSRGALFQQELVQTLADGDPSLLGTPA